MMHVEAVPVPFYGTLTVSCTLSQICMYSGSEACCLMLVGALSTTIFIKALAGGLRSNALSIQAC